MITPVIFVSTPYSTIINEAGIFNENEIGLNIVIDSLEFEMHVVISFVRRFHCNFAVSLAGNILTGTGISKILSQLYTLSTLSSNFRQNNNCIHVFPDAKDDELPALEIVKQYFQLQGESTLDFIIFQPGDGELAKKNVLFLPLAQIKGMDEILFLKYSNYKSHQIILLPQNAIPLDEEITSLKLAIADNKYTKVFLEQAIVGADALWQIHKSSLWKTRAKLYFSFISLSKEVGESQYYNIIEWYKNEYEILPLWYKRFGHILKVLQGKRTVKSLFEKNK